MAKTQIQAIKHSEIAPSRGWLVTEYGKRVIKFAFPSFQGTHTECFQAIARDEELVPAEGIDLALLANGAYNKNTPQWKSVRGNFRDYGVRAPNRVLLIPAGSFKGDKTLSGILVKRDIEGEGLSTEMKVPDLSTWTRNFEGVYVPNNKNYKAVFVPSSAYEGKNFKKDPVVHTHLTPEGAEIFAKTARDAGLVPYNQLAQRVKEVEVPEQRVSLLVWGDSGRLRLSGSNRDWDSRFGFAFGVFSSREASAPKN